MKVWMEISKDRYELPVAVADSAKELARITGVDHHKIIDAAAKSRAKGTRKARFIRVEIEDEEVEA